MADPFVGEIRMFAGDFAPQGWKFCDGQLLPKIGNETLFGLIGTTYGGDQTMTMFALPDMRGRIPIHQGSGHALGQAGGTETVTIAVREMPAHSHQLEGSSDAANALSSPAGSLLADTGVSSVYNFNDPSFTVAMSAQAVSTAGGSGPHDNMAPYLCVNFIIFTTPSSTPIVGPFVGEIRIFAGKVEPVPQGWALCNGQLLPKTQNATLFSLIHTIYGGDGVSTFALPDLRGCSPMQQGHGPLLTNRSLGEQGGEETVTLNLGQLPAHTHQLIGSNRASANTPASNVPGQSGAKIYGPPGNLVPMAGAAVSPTGSSQPHDNRQPYLVLNFIIALQGTEPKRS